MAIAEALENNKFLKILDLSWNKIGKIESYMSKGPNLEIAEPRWLLKESIQQKNERRNQIQKRKEMSPTHVWIFYAKS